MHGIIRGSDVYLKHVIESGGWIDFITHFKYRE